MSVTSTVYTQKKKPFAFQKTQTESFPQKKKRKKTDAEIDAYLDAITGIISGKAPTKMEYAEYLLNKHA